MLTVCFVVYQSFENLSVDSGGSLHERDDIHGTGKHSGFYVLCYT